MKNIYLDNSAATPIDKKVLVAMAAANNKYGNPSSYNNVGRMARKEIESSRLAIARFLDARPEEIVFTSSGSEANNLAILGSTSGDSGFILTTPIEHPSVLESARATGLKIKYIPVDKDGLIDLSSFSKLLTKNCKLISIMYANNEIGTIEPIQKIAKIIKEFRTTNYKLQTTNYPLFHVDACQATGFLDMNVQHIGVDLLTFNGSKIYGPRGIGVLYKRRSVKITPLVFGGSQEYGLRAGTENVSAVAGLVKAISIIKKTESKKVSILRDYAINLIKKAFPEVLINGPIGEDRLANNISICIAGLDSENLLLELDKYNISAGSGSACTSHSVEPSHVLKAISVEPKYINGALRFSLGRETTKKDIDYLVSSLVKIIADLTKRYSRLK